MQDIMQLCDAVREPGFAIHRYHKHGLLINFGATKASSEELFPFLRLLRLFAAYSTGDCWR